MKRKKILKAILILALILLIIILVGLSFYMIDKSRLEKDKEPMFTFYSDIIRDGGSRDYLGLGYKIVKYHKSCSYDNPENKKFYTWYYEGYDIKPWFKDIYEVTEEDCESQKYKAKPVE